MDRQATAPATGPGKRPPEPQPDLSWLTDELQNLLYLVDRAGMQATARDLRFAIRSAEVELRQGCCWKRPPFDESVFFSRDARRHGP